MSFLRAVLLMNDFDLEDVAASLEALAVAFVTCGLSLTVSTLGLSFAVASVRLGLQAAVDFVDEMTVSRFLFNISLGGRRLSR